MGFAHFSHVKISAISAVVPENCINIDDEIQYYDNDLKKLERNKKILGLGTRHILPDGYTSDDLCEYVANKIINETKIEKNDIKILKISQFFLCF